MASRTQLRLGQITGSFGNVEGGIIDTRDAGSATLASVALNSGSLVGVLSELASSVKRLHGAGSFAANAAGEFSQNVVIKGTTPKLTIGDAGNEDTILVFDANAGDMYVGVDHDDGNLHLGAGNTAGTNTNLVLARTTRNAIFKGDVTVEGGKITLTNGSVIDSETTNKLRLTEDEVHTSGNLIVSGTSIDVDAASDLTIGGSVGANALTLGGSSSTVIVAGDFVIEGTNTVVSSSNTTFQDSIIALGVSGSGDQDQDYSNAGDRGILFARAAKANHALAGLWWDNTQFNFAKTATGLLSQSFSTVSDGDYAQLKVGNVLPGEDDTYDLGSTTNAWQDLHMEGDILMTDAGKIETAAGDLTVSSAAAAVVIDAETDITLDAKGNDIFFKDNATTFGTITNNANSLVLSGGNGTGKGIEIASHSGKVLLKTGATSTLYGFVEPNTAGLLISGAAEQGSGQLTLNPNNGQIILKTGHNPSDSFGSLEQDDNAGFILSSSADTDIVLDANSGLVNFTQDGATATRGAADISVAGSFKLGLFDVANNRFDSGAITLKASAAQVISGSTGLAIDAGVTAAQLQIKDNTTNNHYIALKSPNAVGGAVVLTLPGAVPTANGQALVGTTGGVLSFADVGGAATVKTIRIVTGSKGLPAGTVVHLVTADITAGVQQTALSTAEAQGKSLEVFVNGQLLLSGAAGQIGANPTRDYAINSASSLKFAFDLEADDIIQVLNR